MDNASGYMFRLVLAIPMPIDSESGYMFLLVIAIL